MASRTTRQRAAVLEGLAGCQDFVSAQELHARLTAGGHRIGLTTVYRTLRGLVAVGRVDVVRDESGERLYRPRPDDGHQHYLICRACGHSRPVDSAVVEEWADRVSADTGFAAVEHTVELSGICAGCQPCPAERPAEGGGSPCPWDCARPAGRGRTRSCAG
ncbi:Fur family transcriptional regulator [Streptomyces cupreus]|uniref:Transcriptional repressor n=1 Tax=Streptomyces cupreus TaxID=2759956 RepID=A0A7X1J645_9ACTN|nr:Fur family transcriptional regulator [Streptomyces cupreus]MBC2904280.1 transcriptional repressor [Streptomyces cupreus]